MKLDGTTGQFVVVGGNKGFCESIRIGEDIRIAIYDRGEVGEGRKKQPPESEAADELERAH
jgi:hypothetical protein